MKKTPNRKPLSDFVLGKLPPEESLKMLDEIERDPHASKEVDTLAGLATLGAAGDRVFTESRMGLGDRLAAMLKKFRDVLVHRRVILAGSFGLLILAAAVFLADRIVRNPYDNLARVHPDDLVSLVRGPMEDDFTKAYGRIADGNYDDALRTFERFLRAYPRSPLAGYAHYSAGMVCLLSARHTTLGLAPRYNPERVSQALLHLRAAGDGGALPGLVEESHFQSAKAYLMLGRTEDAMNELQAVLATRGQLYSDAVTMMSKIVALERRN